MKTVRYTKTFNKDVKRAKSRSKNIDKLKWIMTQLIEGVALPIRCREHRLRGNYINHFECHIEPDWLLVYKKDDMAIIFERTGTHADLFK